MDKTASVIAALDAGKLPSQSQLNSFIDWILFNIVPSQLGELDTLSKPGNALARAIVEVLAAYKMLGEKKNYDNLVQDTLWHLSEGNFSTAHVQAIDVKEVSADMDALRTALRSLLTTLWANISGEGSHLLSDFTSFMRLALADFAEALEDQATSTKESLREYESEIQRGERDPFGRKYKTPDEEREAADPKVKFEKTMEAVKGLGSKAIGTGQAVKASTEDKASRVRTRLTDAFYQICDRAQSDEDYKGALSTIFNVASKWLDQTLETAAADLTTLDNFIDDPTEDKHLHRALSNIRILCERLAGGKSLDDLRAAFRACAIDIKQDNDLKAWFDDFIAHVRSGLEVPGYARSQESLVKQEQLERRWTELFDSHSEAAKKWKVDLKIFNRELREFQLAFANDVDLHQAKVAHARFARDMQQHVVVSGSLGLQYALEQASWFWQDLFNVYTQRILQVGALKNIPIPR